MLASWNETFNMRQRILIKLATISHWMVGSRVILHNSELEINYTDIAIATFRPHATSGSVATSYESSVVVFIPLELSHDGLSITFAVEVCTRAMHIHITSVIHLPK